MSEKLRSISPIDGAVVVERPYTTSGELDAVLERARRAQAEWRSVPVAERAVLLAEGDELIEACWSWSSSHTPSRSASSNLSGHKSRPLTGSKVYCFPEPE